MITKTKSGRARRLLAIASLSGALMASAAGSALASTEDTGMHLSPGASDSMPTWFFGRTQVCFRNPEPVGGPDVSYNWWSSTTTGHGSLHAGEHDCTLVRSFVGFRIGIQDISLNARLDVWEPIGPA
ncbi:hypothetical protein ACGFMK_36065 [Amycolatopsis sp. NPDC049252]|uniref:hypothetical protein n=1 Tax=Amycolatopsis sp. NPDC049252 TaxID=3363933 RepID=UPI0037147A54